MRWKREQLGQINSRNDTYKSVVEGVGGNGLSWWREHVLVGSGGGSSLLDTESLVDISSSSPPSSQFSLARHAAIADLNSLFSSFLMFLFTSSTTSF